MGCQQRQSNQDQVRKKKQITQEQRRKYNKTYRTRHADKYKITKKRLSREHHRRIKEKVLLGYSQLGRPVCNWVGCYVDDLDMLQLDHLNGGGTQERKDHNGPQGLYRWLIKSGFPPGYQVLCANHNIKKEVERHRQ